MRNFFVKSTILTGLTAILFASCSDPVSDTVKTDPSADPPIAPAIGIAVTTASADYSAANFEIISTDNYSVRQNLFPGLYTDNAIRSFGGDVYILERYGKDNVVKYNTTKTAIEYQEAVGVGLNIQDIAVISETKAYISCHESADMIVFNPSTGKRVSTIDLSRFNTYVGTDSAEAYPYMSSLAVYGDYLYVACQRLNSLYGAADTSLIAVIDTRADTVVTSVKLNKKNPMSMDVFGSKLIVSSSGDWADVTATTSGVEMIDLTSNKNLGLIADGSAFGGALGNVVFVSSEKAYVAVTVGWPDNYIFEFNPQTKTIGAPISGISDGSGGLAYYGSKLYVGNRDYSSSGVAVVNTSTNIVERKISTGMPPSGLAVTRANPQNGEDPF